MNESKIRLVMRRASTFNLLHEAAVIKEMAAPSSAQPPSHLPPTSYKWTWGEQLTETDVRALGRSVTQQQRVSHTGYNLSMNPGQLGQGSSDPSMPRYHGNNDEVLSQESAPPNASGTSLSYFKNHDHLTYDPLGKNLEMMKRIDVQVMPVDASPDQTVPSAPKMAETANAIDIADRWSMDSDAVIKPLDAPELVPRSLLADQTDDPSALKLENAIDIADKWSSDGDKNGSQTSNNNVPSSRDIADEWETDSGNGSADSQTNDMASRPVLDNLNSASERNDPASRIAEEWESASDEDKGSIADVWSSADTNQREGNSADEWTTASQDDSSQPTVNSQLAVSPSRITIRPSDTSFILSQDWPYHTSEAPPNTTSEVPVISRYGPEHFQFLQDHMFEYELSDDEEN